LIDVPLGIRLVDVADMMVVAVLFGSLMVLMRRTRARLALTGFAFLGIVYLVARQIGLQVTAGILQGFFAVLVIVVVVIFQEDLRRFFEQIASWGMGRRASAPQGITDMVVRTVTRLASTRTGGLLVFPGQEDVARHLDGGIALDGKLSEPLLLSLFDASSPGHDGAVLVRGGLVARFAVHLPLSSDHAQLGPGGTRHAAALGLAERCDAMCVVVSEERGTVSVAHQSRLRVLRGPEELAGKLAGFLQEDRDVASEGLANRLRGLYREFWREAVLSMLLAFVVWVVFVPGSALTEITQRVPVVVENLPKEFELESVDPPQVEVRLSLRRRDRYRVDERQLRARIDALLTKLGRRTFELTPEQIDLPDEIRVVEIDPGKIKISVRQRGAPPPGESQ
jgi:diadenylate cyclase